MRYIVYKQRKVVGILDIDGELKPWDRVSQADRDAAIETEDGAKLRAEMDAAWDEESHKAL